MKTVPRGLRNLTTSLKSYPQILAAVSGFLFVLSSLSLEDEQWQTKVKAGASHTLSFDFQSDFQFAHV